MRMGEHWNSGGPSRTVYIERCTDGSGAIIQKSVPARGRGAGCLAYRPTLLAHTVPTSPPDGGLRSEPSSRRHYQKTDSRPSSFPNRSRFATLARLTARRRRTHGRVRETLWYGNPKCSISAIHRSLGLGYPKKWLLVLACGFGARWTLLYRTNARL